MFDCGSVFPATAIQDVLVDLADDARVFVADRVPATHHELHELLGSIGRHLRTSRAGVPVHAGLCTLEGAGVLAVGATGSGKSTLITLLGRRGATFVSDDTVWVHGRTGEGFGAPLSIRRASPFHAEARALPYADDGDRLIVRPADLGVLDRAESATIDLLVFPTYSVGDASYGAISPAAAFCRLVAAALRPCSTADYSTIAELATDCSAATIMYPNSDESLAMLDRAHRLSRPAEVKAMAIDRGVLDEMGFGPNVSAMRFGDEVAVWSAVTGQIVHIDGLPANGDLEGTPAFEQLWSLGFVTRRQDRT